MVPIILICNTEKLISLNYLYDKIDSLLRTHIGIIHKHNPFYHVISIFQNFRIYSKYLLFKFIRKCRFSNNKRDVYNQRTFGNPKEHSAICVVSLKFNRMKKEGSITEDGKKRHQEKTEEHVATYM